MKPATLSQGNQLFKLLLEQNVSLEKLQALLRSGFFIDLLKVPNLESIERIKFQQFLGLALNLDQEFQVKVDWDQTLESKGLTLRKLGFKHVDEQITTTNFPNPAGWSGSSVESLRFMSFGRDISNTAARIELHAANLSTCHPQVLFDFVIANHNLLLPYIASSLRMRLLPSWESRRKAWEKSTELVSFVVHLECHEGYAGMQLKVDADPSDSKVLFPVCPNVS